MAWSIENTQNQWPAWGPAHFFCSSSFQIFHDPSYNTTQSHYSFGLGDSFDSSSVIRWIFLDAATSIWICIYFPRNSSIMKVIRGCSRPITLKRRSPHGEMSQRYDTNDQPGQGSMLTRRIQNSTPVPAFECRIIRLRATRKSLYATK